MGQGDPGGQPQAVIDRPRRVGLRVGKLCTRMTASSPDWGRRSMPVFPDTLGMFASTSKSTVREPHRTIGEENGVESAIFGRTSAA
jgi:hypothetical protein